MKRASKLLAAGLILTGLFANSCKKDNQFPNTPFIRFTAFEQIKDVSGKDSLGILKFYFTDGDGDLGLAPGDTLVPYNPGSVYYYNFFISYYEKQNGSWQKITLPPPFPGADTLSNNSRIPNLTPTGQNKTLEGDLEMQLFTNNPFSPFDTIRYEITMCDRALNRSNQITTPDIVLNK
jgi:hypothetical protein